MARSLTLMLHKTTIFLRSPKAQQVVEQLKLIFTTTAILVLPDTTQAFNVKANASDLVIRVVVSQRHGSQQLLHLCVFYSRKLRPTKQNYEILDNKLLSIKTTFKEWCHCLEGAW